MIAAAVLSLSCSPRFRREFFPTAIFEPIIEDRKFSCFFCPQNVLLLAAHHIVFCAFLLFSGRSKLTVPQIRSFPFIWGIHLTGLSRIRCSPRAVRWRPRQTRRMPAPPRRCWRNFPRSMAGYEVLVAHWGVRDGEF